MVGQHLHRDITWSFRNDTHSTTRGGGEEVTFFFSLSLSLLSASPRGCGGARRAPTGRPLASSHRNGRATSPSPPQPLDRRTRFPIGPDPRKGMMNELTPFLLAGEAFLSFLVTTCPLSRPTAIPVAILQALLCQALFASRRPCPRATIVLFSHSLLAPLKHFPARVRPRNRFLSGRECYSGLAGYTNLCWGGGGCGACTPKIRTLHSFSARARHPPNAL